MEVHLTPELENLIAARMASGRYDSPEQIIVEALRGTARVDGQRDEALAALRRMMDENTDERQAGIDWLQKQSDLREE